MNSKKIIGAIWIILFSTSIAFSQNNTVTAGKDINGLGGSISYSIGQIDYITLSTINGLINQGIQQPYEISVITILDYTKMVDLNLTAFPNPVTNYLILKVNITNAENMYYQIFDINGKLLENEKIDTAETNIAMNQLASATYFLKVSNNSDIIKTFKIIKN